MNYELGMAGRERWQSLLDEAEQSRLAQRHRPPKRHVRPRLARALLALATWLDPALSSARLSSSR